MTSARIVSCSSFGSWAIRTLRRMSARVIPACIMIAPASLRVSGLPRPSSLSRRARFRSTRSFAALVWTAAFAALASLLAIARSAAPMSLRHLQSYRSARDAAPPRSADPPWRSTSRSSSGVGIGIRSSTASRILLCSSTIRFERAERRSCKRRQNAMRSTAEVGTVIAPSPAICSWRALPPSRRVLNQAHLQPVGSFAEADEHRVVVSFSLIIRLCEKPRHYTGAVVTSPAPTHPNLRMGRLFVQVSALRDRELLHTLAPVGFENGDHLSLWDFARRPVEEVRNCSARAGQRPLLRAVVPFMEKICGPQRST